MTDSSRPCATIGGVDHIVLTVTSIPTTIEWYTTHLGMKHQEFPVPGESPRHALAFGDSKINLHQKGSEFEPKADKVQVGSGDLCFWTSDPVEDVLKRLKSKNVEILEGGGVVDRTGAKGKLRSVYIRDPDGNLIEISNRV